MLECKMLGLGLPQLRKVDGLLQDSGRKVLDNFPKRKSSGMEEFLHLFIEALVALAWIRLEVR